MRLLQFSLLSLSITLFLNGCAESERPMADHAARETAAPASESAPMEVTPTSGPTAGSKAETSSADAGFREMASAPEADFGKTEPPRSPEPAEVAESRPEAEESPKDRPREQQRRRMQAGTLTAGSLNDHENLPDFRDYLSTVQQHAAGGQVPAFSLGERVLIEIKDAQGNGLGNAQVTVTQLGQTQDQNEGVLLDTWTRADGRTFFATGLDVSSGEDMFELTVRPPNGQPLVQQVSLSQSPWVVEVPQVSGELPNKLDLSLVVDTTGSMGDELNFLKVEIDHIAQTIHRMYPNVDQRYSLIVYRDEHDAYVRRVFDFTSSLEDFRKDLANQSAGGGGDYPEAMHIALEAANKLDWRKENTARVMFLVADAPPHRQHADRTLQSVRDLRRQGVAVYPLAGSGARADCEFILRTSAFLTRGQYLFLTDHSGIGNPHAKPTAPKYEVEPLDQLMIRMIASELSGKPVLAKDIIATEESDGSEPPPIPQEQNQSAIDPPEYNACHPRTNAIAHSTTNEVTLWESTAFRFIVAFALIGGILLLDHRLRS